MEPSFVDDRIAGIRALAVRQAPPSLFEHCLQHCLRNARLLAATHVPHEVSMAFMRKALVAQRLLGATPVYRDTCPPVVDVLALWDGPCDESGLKMAFSAELLRRLLGVRVVLHAPLHVASTKVLAPLAFESDDPQMRVSFASGVQPLSAMVGAQQTGPQSRTMAALDVLQALLVCKTDTFPSPLSEITVAVTNVELHGAGLGRAAALVPVGLVAQDIHRWTALVAAAAMRALLSATQSPLRGFCAEMGCPLSQPGQEGLLPCETHRSCMQRYSGVDMETWCRGMIEIAPWEAWRYTELLEQAEADANLFLSQRERQQHLRSPSSSPPPRE